MQNTISTNDHRIIVLKFGGTSVADAAAIARAAEITRSRLGRRPVVVVSALAGTTNQLLGLAERAAWGALLEAIQMIEAVRERHLAEATALLVGMETPCAAAARDAGVEGRAVLRTGGESAAGAAAEPGASAELAAGPDAVDPAADADDVRADLTGLCDELANLAHALSVLGHLTPRVQDAIVSHGELLSSRLVAAAFRARGLPAELVDACRVIVTDDRFTRATPRLDAIERAAREILRPAVVAGRVPVLGGFIGATAEGVTTTLGRGGSDFSAALIGAALDADAIEIWTDVDGILTADPRVVPGARCLERIRFDEAAELAAFGARVLHPATIAPAAARGVPVCIYNSRRPEGAGTRITNDAPRRAVRAIAARPGVTVVRVRSSSMLMAHGFLRALFEVFERHRNSVDVVATSEVSVSVTIDDDSSIDAIAADLAALGEVTVERDRAVLALVGSALEGEATTMARALGALRGIRVHMLSLSATDINLTLVVDADRAEDALRALHAEFFAGEPAPDETSADAATGAAVAAR